MPVRIVTDSSAVLPEDWISRYRIGIVPLTVAWNGEEYLNGELSYEEFDTRIATGAVPKTSAPSPGRYQAAYEQALGEADALLVVTPPSELSATYSNATLAAQLVDGDIDVLDSRSAAAGQGLVALEAARAAEGGASLEAVRSRAELVLARVRLWATLERLDYLRRSGRVPAVAAFATNALDLHPVFRFVDGSPTPVTAPRGVRRAAERVLRAWMESTPDDASRAHVIIFHAARDQDAEDMRRRVLDRDPNTEVSVVHIKAAMAAHVGPGILGLAWWWE